MTPVRYTLKQASQTLYNGTSRHDSATLAKSLGYERRAGKGPTDGCIVEEVVPMGQEAQIYYWHKRK